MLLSAAPHSASYPDPVARRLCRPRLRFSTGEVLPELKLHYTTRNPDPRCGRRGAQCRAGPAWDHRARANFLTDGFAGTLFGPGQPLDATRYFIIFPDSIGNGQSSKPSDGCAPAFPLYLRRHAGVPVSAVEREARRESPAPGPRRVHGGMHAWLWGQTHRISWTRYCRWCAFPRRSPAAIACSGALVIDAIRNDPEWNGGNYTKPPRVSPPRSRWPLIVASSARQLQPTRRRSSGTGSLVGRLRCQNASRRTMPTIFLYAREASRSYDPAPVWTGIRALRIRHQFRG
mgnify:CR=1 FL=1